MEAWFYIIDEKMGGWPRTALMIITEIVIVYLLSHIPFILSSLNVSPTSGEENGLILNFIGLISEKVNHGELLAFTCALIAPAIFWSMAEFKKAFIAKLLCFISLLVWTVCVYVYGQGENLAQLDSLYIYYAAVTIWVLSILCRLIPPENKQPSPNKKAAILTEHLRNIEGNSHGQT